MEVLRSDAREMSADVANTSLVYLEFELIEDVTDIVSKLYQMLRLISLVVHQDAVIALDHSPDAVI